jgi:hypothetical protein
MFSNSLHGRTAGQPGFSMLRVIEYPREQTTPLLPLHHRSYPAIPSDRERERIRHSPSPPGPPVADSENPFIIQTGEGPPSLIEHCLSPKQPIHASTQLIPT